MRETREQLKQFLTEWLIARLPDYADLAFVLIVFLWISTVALVIHLILHRVALKWVEQHANSMRHSKYQWRETLLREKFYSRIVLMFQGLIVKLQAGVWLDSDTFSMSLVDTGTQVWVVLFGTLSLFALLNAFSAILRRSPATSQLPITGLLQGGKLIITILSALLILAMLMGTSPLLLLSGLGAVSAVLMLVFKDPLLGLAAGFQLSANNMLSVGDWLEMPQYDADGDVIDIGLTTVKVQNWDKTVTSVPTYALISESFKNWRGMSEAGGRRIKRSFFVDTKSICFLTDELLGRMKRIQILAPYLEARSSEVSSYNSQQNADSSSPVNGRHLTNIGTFRAYLTAYLRAHPGIHQGMTLMVRQGAPGATGLPLELYAFTNTTDWVEYERIQADIFDHLFAVLPEFELRAHEAPTGHDMRGMADNFARAGSQKDKLEG